MVSILNHAYRNHLLIFFFVCVRRSSRTGWSATRGCSAAGPRNQSAGQDALRGLEPNKDATWRSSGVAHQEEAAGGAERRCCSGWIRNERWWRIKNEGILKTTLQTSRYVLMFSCHICWATSHIFLFFFLSF